MRRKTLLSVLGIVWVLCFGLIARGQSPITITGPTTVCAGNTGPYAITPTAGYHYAWSVTPQGVIPGSPTGSTITVNWGTNGSATVTVMGYDASNTLQQLGTLAVTVEPIPAPYITANKIAGCQNYADSTTDTNGKHTTPSGPGILTDTSGCPKVCDSSVVIYTAHGPAGSTFGWVVTGGQIQSTAGNTCTVYWNGPVGYGNITVYDTSAFGCVGSTTVCLNIIARPHAYFIGLMNVCLDQPDIFLDLSTTPDPTSPIINWFWSFGDGTTFTSATSSSVTHAWTTPGVKLVTLVVRNECGCTDTFEMKVVVNPKKGVTIVCPGVVCDSATAEYSLSPVVSCSSYNWAVSGGNIISGSGTPNITVQWTDVDSSGFGYVLFAAGPCATCGDTTIIKVPVITPKGYIFGPKNVCTSTQYLYQLPQWPTTIFTWTIVSGSATLLPTDQNNQIALTTGATAGTIILKCEYMNTLLGCGGLAYDTITVDPPDYIVGSNRQCFGSTGTYVLADGATGTWTLTYPDLTTFTTTTSSFNALFNQVGTYELTTTGAFCLAAPLTITVDSLPPIPDSLVGPDTVCFGTSAVYHTGGALPGTTFDWAIQTGTLYFASGSSTTAVFSGSSPATIMVWRESGDAEHCHSDTLAMQVYQPYVHLNITGVDTVCPSTEYTYNAGYTGGETYNWQIYGSGMGSVETNGTPTSQILYNTTSGPAIIVLTVTKCDSTYPNDTFHVYVRPTTVLAITLSPDTVCRGVPFIATLLNGNIGHTTWNWGDGTSVSGYSLATTSYAYPEVLGTSFNYVVVCSVDSPYGCPGTVTANESITVLPAPVANISPDGPFSSCTYPSQPLTATISTGFEPTDSLAWENTVTGFLTGCPGPAYLCNPYTVTNYGTYYVIAVGANGCLDTSNKVEFDTCQGPPVPCFIAGHPYARIDSFHSNCGTVELYGSYASFPTAFSWQWTWPTQAQGVTTTSTTLNCNFLVAGIYHFTYIVGFTDGPDTCYVYDDTDVTVPFIAGMGHTVLCASASGGYDLTMLDHSNYYPGHLPYKYSWYVNTMHVGTTTYPTTSFTTFLTPGTYSLSEWVYYGPGTTDSCEAFDNVFLDSLPHANFTFSRDSAGTCVDQASVQFTNLSTPTSSTWSSLWDFGDLTGNTQTNPWKVYSSIGLKFVTLTVTNEYGCFSDTTIPVTIVAEDLAGRLTGDSIVCAGSIVTLTYHDDVGSSSPNTYYWLNGIDTLYYTTINTTNVYSSGDYWVIGTDIFGCYDNTNHINVTVITPPPAFITGDTSECLNVPYTLNGYAGSDPGITYTWLLGGSIVGTGPTYTNPALTAGLFTYRLVISVPNPLTGFCTDTSAPFTVDVHNPPAPPTISTGIVNCTDYEWKLTAGGPTYDTYNWSNSMSGQTILVTEAGGPYKVWCTDTFGCVSSSTVTVTPDPRLYMWVFPSGCYQWCYATGPRTIIGPIQTFYYWAYLFNLVTIAEYGFSTPVGSLSINTSGTYQLILDNSYCTDTSATMTVAIDSPCEQCKNVTFRAVETYQTHCDGKTTNPDTCCHTFIVINFHNTLSSPVGIDIMATNGSLVPGGALVMPGSQLDTFQFLNDPGFYSGAIVITITYIDPATGEQVLCRESVEIQPCNPKAPREANPNGGSKPIVSVNGPASIRLVPNPAQNSTRVDYQFSGDPGGSYIEVFDMTGRRMSSTAVTDNNGSLQLQLDNYAAGIYQVVLRQGGTAILQSKLSVIR